MNPASSQERGEDGKRATSFVEATQFVTLQRSEG
jgi:hypothetical protein